ncbi:MAG: LCP family protein [Clostridia bacterium]|nr:LCP family protein [Clostridia bacterium]
MKRSLRDYLLTLAVGAAIFTVVAIFLIRAAEGLMGDVVHKIGAQEEETNTGEILNPVTQESLPAGSGNVQTTPTEEVTATFLLLGVDHGEKNADAIFLVGINATQKKATVSLIPSDTVVTEGDQKHKLGELYSTRNANFYREFVAQETGITADYYVSMPMFALSNLIDFLGGIQYAVPEDMYYFDPTQNLKINLKKGSQLLTGDQAVQLVAYRGYEKGKTAREDTQLGFARAFCTTFLRPENLSRAKAIMYNVMYNVETDFEELDLNALGEVIFGFDSYEQSFVRIPGSATSAGFYAISTSKAKELFKIYS